jgi:DNA-binding response OmpR family regulator/HPt (histidine-containing phosphotransfer) domain-containing protein
LDESGSNPAAGGLEEIYARQRVVLLEQLDALEDASAAALLDDLTNEMQSEAKRHAHRMAGAAGMFGYPAITPIARELEEHLAEAFDGTSDLPRRIAALVIELRKHVELGPQLDPDDEWGAEPEAQKSLAVISSDARFVLRLGRPAEELGFRIERDPSAAGCTVAIVDATERIDAMETVARLSGERPPTPVIVLVNDPHHELLRDTFAAGARAVLAKTAPPRTIVDCAATLAELTNIAGMHVLLCSTDDGIIRRTRFVLSGDALQLHAISSTDEIFAGDDGTPFDLVLLDEPDTDRCSEICRRFRRDLRTQHAPVILLLTEVGEQALAALLEAGASGCVKKPLQPRQLQTIVRRELERVGTQSEIRPRTDPDGSVAAEVPSEQGSRTEPTTESNRQPRQPTVDIVLVEDDEALAPLLVHTFEARGLRCAHFESGSVARAALTGNPPDVLGRVLVLDWDLPGVNGLNVLQALSSAGTLEDTRVLMLTGRSNEHDVLRALELGASDHVTKPFSVAVLMQRIERLLHILPGSR